MEEQPKMSSMKTTLDIPEGLLEEAMKATGATTKRDAVLRALEEFNRRDRLRKLTERLGRSDTFMTTDELAQLRHADIGKAGRAKSR